MDFKGILKKLTSRKLWVAVAGIVTGIATLVGAEASDIQAVAGAVLSAASILGYLAAESAVDKAAVEAFEEPKEEENK